MLAPEISTVRGLVREDGETVPDMAGFPFGVVVLLHALRHAAAALGRGAFADRYRNYTSALNACL
jgi:hypothetical protein